MAQTDPIGADAILAKKKAFLIPCVYHFYNHPPQIVRGQGTRVYDTGGKAYLDLYSGVSVHALGHCHPELTAAICDQVSTLQHSTTIYLTEPIVNLAEAMAQVLPGDIQRTFFCASGSEANEGAALLATLHTGRSEFLALQGGLHGRTKLGMSLTGLSFWRTDPHPVGGITLVPAPHCRHCPFSQTFGNCAYACVQAVRRAILSSTSGEPAAMFLEPVQGNGGIVVPPDGYMPRLKELLDEFGILLVADEVQSGFGRTGQMFAMDHWGVVPDIVTGGKALGGGTPVGFFSTTDKIASSYTRPGASTFGGNPVTAKAGLTFLKILQRDGLVRRSEELGSTLRAQLEQLAAEHACIQDVRGLGLMVGVELGDNERLSAAESTDLILEEMKDAGFLLGKTGPGRNVLTFMPPLVIAEEDLQQAVGALDKALMNVAD